MTGAFHGRPSDVRASTAGWKQRAGPVEFFGADAIQDPYPLYDRMRAEGPVHRIGDSGFYAVCGWDAINEVIGRPEDFSSNLTATMTYTPEGTIVPFEMDPLGRRAFWCVASIT